ncbi:hypothetical protein Mapa_002772 [Marchantia paleacea]|nr:hypothetical protein Mapa_002772 [Marchantia paleacea]
MGSRMLAVPFLLVLVVGTQGAETVFTAENRASNTPGGIRFDNEIGIAWTVEMLQTVKSFIINTLSMSPEKQRDLVQFYLEDFDGAAYSSNNNVHVAANYLNGLAPANDGEKLKFELQGLMYHELSHIWQNNLGDYNTDMYFRGVIEGIATWMELVAGYGVADRKSGGNWYDGYDTTAHFLKWIEDNKVAGFVNQLNKRMGQVQWNNDNFRVISGTDVNVLWADYQAAIL